MALSSGRLTAPPDTRPWQSLTSSGIAAPPDASSIDGHRHCPVCGKRSGEGLGDVAPAASALRLAALGGPLLACLPACLLACLLLLPRTHTRLACATDANPTNLICTSKLPVAASAARHVSLPPLLLLKVYCTRRRQGSLFSRPSQTDWDGAMPWYEWVGSMAACRTLVHLPSPQPLGWISNNAPARPLLLVLGLGPAWQHPRRVISPSTDTGPIASHSPSQPSWPAVGTSTDVSTTTTLLSMSPCSLLLLHPTRSSSWPAAVWPRQKNGNGCLGKKVGAPSRARTDEHAQGLPISPSRASPCPSHQPRMYIHYHVYTAPTAPKGTHPRLEAVLRNAMHITHTHLPFLHHMHLAEHLACYHSPSKPPSASSPPPAASSPASPTRLPRWRAMSSYSNPR